MRFLIDAQLPPRLAQALSDAGHKAEHVVDLGLATAPDQAIWTTTIEKRAILITKDQDFAVARAASDVGPTIVWIRIGNTSNAVLVAHLLRSLDAIEQAWKRGDGIVELIAR